MTVIHARLMNLAQVRRFFGWHRAAIGVLAGLTLIATFVIADIAASSPASAATLAWSTPVELSSLHQNGSLGAISCPSQTACTALGNDSAGAIALTRTSGAWGTPVSVAAGLQSVSCSDATDCVAVGEDSNDQPIYVTETDGSWGGPVELPVTGSGGLSNVTCTTAGNCEAVGDGSGGTLYAVETAGTWTPASVLSEPDNWDGSVVTCASVGNCTVLGTEGPPSVPASLVETDGAWGTPAPLPSPVATQLASSHVGLLAMSCNDATDCTAVGWSPANSQSYALTESAGVWSTFSALTSPPGGDAFVLGVSCTAPGNCTAVGYGGNESYEGGPLAFTDQPMQATETDGTWSALTLLPAAAGAGDLGAVSCSDPGDCTAVGSDTGNQSIYSTETSGTWSVPTEVPMGAAATGSFSAVSCPTAGSCTAVGADSNSLPIYATETNGAWGALTQLATPTTGAGSFTGVSCPTAGNCTAVGADEAFPMYATETDGVWAAPQLLLGGSNGPLNAVSCSGVGNCTAVGEDATGQPDYVTETDGTWGMPTELSFPSGTGSFTGVSCSAAANCTAAGTDSNLQPLYATETAGTWSTPVEVAAGGSTKVTGVSCSSAGNCTAVGYGSGGEGNGPLIYDTETEGTWAAPTGLTAGGSPSSGLLSSVSCTDATDCTAVGDTGAADSGTGAPVYVTEMAGSWGTPTAISDTPTGTGEFEGVSCTGASGCTAVGFDGNGEPIYATSAAATVVPTVSAVSPNSGPTSGGTAVTITGTGFVAGATVVIGQGNGAAAGAIPATNVTVVSPTEITAVTGTGAKAGTFSLFVATSGGTSAGNLGDDFTYTIPTVSTVSPNPGPTSCGWGHKPIPGACSPRRKWHRAPRPWVWTSDSGKTFPAHLVSQKHVRTATAPDLVSTITQWNQPPPFSASPFAVR